MASLSVGQRVQVRLDGLQTESVRVGGGVSASGTITALDQVRRLATVQLDVSFDGRNIIEVPFDEFS